MKFLFPAIVVILQGVVADEVPELSFVVKNEYTSLSQEDAVVEPHRPTYFVATGGVSERDLELNLGTKDNAKEHCYHWIAF
jgi:hypothetical protein